MAREVSLLQLRTWARQLSDTENDPNITDVELTALANRHLPEVYDRLVDAGTPDYFAATTTLATSPGIASYPLEVDFRNLVNVYVRETGGHLRSLLPMPHNARGSFTAPLAAATLELEYIPVPPTLENDGDTFDGVSGFEELIANLMARDVMAKRESDPSIVMNNIANLEQRITSRARARDKGQPKRIVDTDEDAPTSMYWGGSSRIACYRLRAGNLEVYESAWWQ